MPQQFLNGANIVTAFEQMRGKGMAQSMGGGRLGDPCRQGGFFNIALHLFFLHMVATLAVAARVDRIIFSREHILPPPILGGILVFGQPTHPVARHSPYLAPNPVRAIRGA